MTWSPPKSRATLIVWPIPPEHVRPDDGRKTHEAMRVDDAVTPAKDFEVKIRLTSGPPAWPTANPSLAKDDKPPSGGPGRRASAGAGSKLLGMILAERWCQSYAPRAARKPPPPDKTPWLSL
jgi:hypothetical protein